MKMVYVLLVLAALGFSEDYLYYTLIDVPDGYSFTTQYWCLQDCHKFERPVKVLVVADPRAYCGGDQSSLKYAGGCAILQNDTVVARMWNGINAFKTYDTVNHEFLHLYMWQVYRDANHSDAFYLRYMQNRFEPLRIELEDDVYECQS